MCKYDERNFHKANCTHRSTRKDLRFMQFYLWNAIYRRNTPVYPCRVANKRKLLLRMKCNACNVLNANISGAFTVSWKNGLHIKTLYGNYYFTSASLGEFTNKIFITPFEPSYSKSSLYVKHLRKKYYVPLCKMTECPKVIFNESYIIENKNRLFFSLLLDSFFKFYLFFS